MMGMLVIQRNISYHLDIYLASSPSGNLAQYVFVFGKRFILNPYSQHKIIRSFGISNTQANG
ncbi:hypothetical protein CEK65_17560 [Xanthomonas sp. LMG 12459]|nr:hypothetical protein CEK65_17560 [Xanthomonas sp. LMG 12459]